MNTVGRKARFGLVQHHHVLTGFAAVDGEAALLAHEGLAEPGAAAHHLAGVGVGRPGHGALREAAAGRSYCRIHRQGRHFAGVGHIHQTRT